MIEQEFRIIPEGHSWDCLDSMLKLGGRFRCNITFRQDNKVLNAKGFMWIGSLHLDRAFSVVYDGIDEQKAAHAYAEVLEMLKAS